MHRKWMGVACAAALLVFCGAASADPQSQSQGGAQPNDTYSIVGPSGLVNLDYAYSDSDHSNANTFGGGAAAAVPFGTSWGIQAQGGYHYSSFDGDHANLWEVGGSGFWQGDMGRAGVAVDYNNDSGEGVNLGFVSYGGFGELYASDAITVGLKGGGISATGSVEGCSISEYTAAVSTSRSCSGSGTGGYVGAEFVGYVWPDLSLDGSVDYASLEGISVTDLTARVDYLFSETTPIAAFASYTYEDFDGGARANGNVFQVGLTYYIGGSGSLVQRRRNAGGVDEWGPEDNAVRILQ